MEFCKMTTTNVEHKVKRNRGNNFTKEEELLLLSEIEKYKEIIECKMTDKVNASEKSEAWRKIQIGFNAKNDCHRNLDQIKVKYDNLKCKTRKIVSTNKNYIRGTGGGPAENLVLDPVVESVLRIINKTSVVGLYNENDCDVSTEVESIKINQMYPTPVKIVCENESLPTNKEDSWEICYENNGELIILNEENTESQTVEFQAGTSFEGKKSAVFERENKNGHLEEQEKNKQTKQTWNKYTPKKLRTPMSRRLRQVVNNPIKDDYYMKKLS